MAEEFHEYVMDQPQAISSLFQLCCTYVTNNCRLLFNSEQEGPSSSSATKQLKDQIQSVETFKFRESLPRHLYQPIFDCLFSANENFKIGTTVASRENYRSAFICDQEDSNCLATEGSYCALWNLSELKISVRLYRYNTNNVRSICTELGTLYYI